MIAMEVIISNIFVSLVCGLFFFFFFFEYAYFTSFGLLFFSVVVRQFLNNEIDGSRVSCITLEQIAADPFGKGESIDDVFDFCILLIEKKKSLILFLIVD